jgi:regulator of replication initiation timing
MGILDNAKEVATAVHEIKNLELYAKVLDLNRGIMDLVDENRKLHAENHELKEKFKLREKMTFKAPFYYQEGDETPFCSVCWEDKKAAIHLKFGMERDDGNRWDCPACHNMFMDKNGRRARRITPSQINPWA